MSSTLQLMLLLLLSTGNSLGQSPSFNKLIQETNSYLAVYDELNPHYDNYIPFDSLELSKKQLQLIKDDCEECSEDSIHEYTLIFSVQSLIMENVTKILAHKNFGKQPIEALLNNNSDLSITISDDRKIYNFSIDEKAGGTYRSRFSITYFTEDSLSPQLKSRHDNVILHQHDVFEGDGLSGIYSLGNAEDQQYVITSYVRGCSYCFETKATLITYINGRFEEEFSYMVNSRHWEGGVSYNPEQQTITANYDTDDLTTDCDCYNHSDYPRDHEEESQIKKRCHCTFRFNGETFEAVKASWEILNKQ
jgi:hypothetical protein